MKEQSIAFFFPYYEVSGVPVLFLNLAEYIAEKEIMDVFVVDYKEGFMSKNRKIGSKVKIIPFKDGEKFHLETDMVVIQSILPYAIRPELSLSLESKVLFWNLHPDNFFPIVFPFNFFSSYAKNNLKIYKLFLNKVFSKKMNRLRDFIVDLHTNNALVFMDSSNLIRTNEILDLNITKTNFLPIACGGNLSSSNFNEGKEKKEINVSWVGRICDFKVYILKYLIEQLSKLSLESKMNIKLHIIGNGDKIEIIKDIALEHGFFETILLGTIPKNELDEYLNKNIDINASMGTSALESARLSIPTILLDFSEKEIKKDYVFRWLHNTENFDVGHVISESDYKKNNSSLQHMLQDFLNNENLLKEQSYNYYRKNHSVEQVAEKLLKLLENKTVKLKEIKTFNTEKSMLRRFYEYQKYKL